jgi:RND family efflux transporter MFP subunit
MTKPSYLRSWLVAGLLALVLVAAPLKPVFASAMTQVGVLYPQDEFLLSFGVSGLVAEVLVKPGYKVRAGQPLVRLDTQLQEVEQQRRRLIVDDQVEQDVLTQRLAVLTGQLQRAEQLFAQSRSISLDDLERLRLEHITLEGRLLQLQNEKRLAQLEYQAVQLDIALHSLRAPADGQVIEVQPSRGEWARQGEPVLRLVNISQLRLKLNVPDGLARRLVAEQAISVNIEGQQTVMGALVFISPVADPASGLVELHINLANPDGVLRPGSKASINLDHLQ